MGFFEIRFLVFKTSWPAKFLGSFIPGDKIRILLVSWQAEHHSQIIERLRHDRGEDIQHIAKKGSVFVAEPPGVYSDGSFGDLKDHYVRFAFVKFAES